MLYILTLSWNGKDKLSKLYPSLLNNLTDIKYNWLVKDNGSNDGSVDYLKSLNNSNITIIECPHNMDSFALGMNKLFAACNASDEDLILLLNNDIIFNDNNSIKNMIKLFKNSEVGIVGARLLYPDNKIQHAGVIFHRSNNLPIHFRSGEESNYSDKLNREFQAVTGAVVMTKAKYYKNICQNNKSTFPGLNEEYIWMYEDIDACLNIKYKQNKKVIYCGETSICHEESASIKKNPMNRMFLQQNINTFKKCWNNIYQIDDKFYLENKNYLLYKNEK